MRKSQSTCSDYDALHFKTNFGYMLKQNRNKTLDDMKKGATAVIEHMWDEHEYCSVDWCRALKLEEAIMHNTNLPLVTDPTTNGRPDSPTHSPEPQRPHELETSSFYRSKDTDNQLYQQMWEAYGPCILPHRLRESLHPYDTQTNESLNNMVAKYAPKTKSLGTTMALTHRINVVIGVHNLGLLEFWKRVYDKLEMEVSPLLHDYLETMDKNREIKKQYKKQSSVKRKRNRDKYLKIQAGIKKAKQDEKRGTTYRSGIEMENAIPPVVEQIEAKRKKDFNVECTILGCHESKHKRRSSQKCTYHDCSKDMLKASIVARLRELYPSHFGKCFIFWMQFFFIFVL